MECTTFIFDINIYPINVIMTPPPFIAQKLKFIPKKDFLVNVLHKSRSPAKPTSSSSLRFVQPQLTCRIGWTEC